MGHFQELRDLLDEAGIEWHDNSDSLFARTQGEYNGREFSAIQGEHSYGGAKGYLEVRMDEEEPIGWLTAKQARDLIAGTITDEQADQESAKTYKAEKDRFLQGKPWNHPAEAVSAPGMVV